jgi:hypothetical protein
MQWMTLSVCAALVCAVSLVAGARPAEAGINVWTSLGPPGGSVQALAADPTTPTTLYAGTGGAGVYKIEQVSAHTYTAMPPVTVSGASPFAACTADARAGQSFVPNSEFEPLIAVNPIDPMNIVGLWEQDRWLDGAGARGQVIGVSFDRGMSWESVVVPGLSICSGGAQYSADPWLSFAPNGDLYHIAYTYLEPPVEPGTRFAVLVNKSTDGGRTWSVPVALNEAVYPALNNTPSITADPRDPRSVYAAWSLAEDTHVAFLGPALFSHSSDGGESWDAPRVLYRPTPGSVTASPQIIVLPDGTLLNVFTEVTSATRRYLSVQRSTDGGATWLPDGPPIHAFSYRGIIVVVPTTEVLLLTAGDPSIALDRASGALYAAWQGGAQAKVNFSTSTDGGLTWSAPVVIAKTPANTDARLTQSFLPAIHVARDGTVGVTYYDFRNDTADASVLTDTWFIWCQPAQVDCAHAESWTGEVRLTPTSLDLTTAPHVYGLFLGNHVGLASDGDDFLALFPQSSAEDASSMYFVRLAAVPCAGDCNTDGEVTVDELLSMVNVALGNTDVAVCVAGDANGDAGITVDEILSAVNNALQGCAA